MPISDIVFLDGNEPEEVLYCEDQAECGIWFRAKNIDSVPLSKLGEILGVGTCKELSSGFQPAVPPEGEAFLLNFPVALKNKIASCSAQEIESASNEWVKIDEFRGGMSTEMARKYISSLKEFLQNSDEDVFLFLSI
ncbi:hypothetical protein ACJJIK_02230 [Microbulbifer sp. ZKSA006]|uniref:hypothetical protein n=1 Tax=Microbulbifer sp. ZKSA006 TaxID=3243390 RepID=UPI0040397512